MKKAYKMTMSDWLSPNPASIANTLTTSKIMKRQNLTAKHNFILGKDSVISLNALRKDFTFFFIIILFFGCIQNSKESVSEQKVLTTDIQTDNFQYLNKPDFSFEELSGEAIIGKAVKANDKIMLSYELKIVNAFRDPIKISKIEVFDYEKNKVLSTFDSTYLKFHLLRPGIESFDEVLKMKASGFSIANLLLEVKKEEIPNNIFHRVSFMIKRESGEIQETTVDVALEEFPEQTDLQIGLPFHPGKWFYVANAHRDARLITEGKPTFPQRYAIDWVALTHDNKLRSDNTKTIESFKTYGEDILAVCNAKVVFVKDGVPDNNPFGNKFEVEINRETVGGNYVVLDIGNGIYAFYGHLIPGSLTVDIGDKVSKGDVIGKLGNGGRSFAPHLHFHLETKSKYPLGGEGVPYTLESFHQLASFEDEEIVSILSSSYNPLEMDEKPIYRTNQLPVGNGVVEFKINK